MKKTALLLALLMLLSLLFTACQAQGSTASESTAQTDTASSDTAETKPEEETETPEEPTETEEPEEPAADYVLPGWDDSLPSICETYQDAFLTGAAVNTDALREGTDFYRLLTKHYNLFVTENEMKPEYVNPAEGVFKFDAPDRFVDFGESVGAALRGHTLVWHQQVPSWWFQGADGGDATAEELLSRMETYISTVVGRYRGRIHTWDVVNEAMSDSGAGLRRDAENSKWASIIGDLDGDGNDNDYIEQAFCFARAADPDAQLIINDYSLESDTGKLNAMYNQVKSMLEKGIPIDGVGIQAHIQMGYPMTAVFEAAIEKLASLKEYNPDFKVQITELDVSVFDWNDQSKIKDLDAALQTQLAERYADLFDMFRRQAEKGNLDMVVTWGVYDGRSWLDGYPVSGRVNAPLLFDRKYMTKPAFWGVIDRSLIPAAVEAYFAE